MTSGFSKIALVKCTKRESFRMKTVQNTTLKIKYYNNIKVKIRTTLTTVALKVCYPITQIMARARMELGFSVMLKRNLRANKSSKWETVSFKRKYFGHIEE